MLARLAALLLSPVLLLQALHVRRHALRLPEADGARTGRVGDGTPLSLLILGDSAASASDRNRMRWPDS